MFNVFEETDRCRESQRNPFFPGEMMMYVSTSSWSISPLRQGGPYSIQLFLVLANVIFVTTLIPDLTLMLKKRVFFPLWNKVRL